MRPISLKHMCLAQFAKRYERVRDGTKIQDEQITLSEKENSINEDFIITSNPKFRKSLPKNIKLTGSLAAGESPNMRLRKPLVLRFHKFKENKEPHNYYFSELELYHIFKSKRKKTNANQSLKKVESV